MTTVRTQWLRRAQIYFPWVWFFLTKWLHGYNIFVQPDDVLCFDCYLLHLMIIKSYESMLVGSNEQLQHDIDLWIGEYENDKTNEPTKTI